MTFLSLVPLGRAAQQIGMLPAALLSLGERGGVRLYVVGADPAARHYLQTGDVEELAAVVRARKLQAALLGPSEEDADHA